MNILEAIAKQEGFDVPGSRAQRNHNPGNIVWGTFAKFHGAIGEDTTGVPKGAGFAVFPDDETGWRALGSLLATPVYRSLTVQQAIYRYAPPSENQTGVYIQNVCAMTGLQPDDPISKGLTRPSAATALFLSALLGICVAILLAGKRRREKVAEERARIEAKEAEIEREWASVFVHKSNQ